MNIFQFYVFIYGSKIHLLSIVSVSTILFLAVRSQKIHSIPVRMTNSFLAVLLGHYIYEDLFIVFIGFSGRSLAGLPLYLIITVGIMAIIYISDSMYPSFKIYSGFPKMIFILLVIFTAMHYVGWFDKLQQWFCCGGPDPHNLLWYISKLVGFFTGVFFIKGDNLK